MIKYLAEARWLFGAFRHFTISKVSCTHSKEPGRVKLFRPTISIPEVATTEVEHSWIDEIFRNNKDGSLLKDKATTRRIRRAKAWYCMVCHVTSKLQQVVLHYSTPSPDFLELLLRVTKKEARFIKLLLRCFPSSSGLFSP
ncbi:hypothetical protein B296_00009854 [Ensete ventricosum]|uniref:Uncharacterized protein n=1 Tax=Ensete ventricosum TaxID=4639 RepID=A0A427AK40_ENSVE|nr:hypothetical protein B296_00009854 [Ensete ventricosum]